MFVFIYVYLNLYCIVLWCMLCRAPGKQPLTEGRYPVEIKVNNNNSTGARNLKMKSFNISYRKCLTCHGGRMNPLEHRQVLCGFKLWYQ